VTKNHELEQIVTADDPRWQHYTVGGGAVETYGEGEGLRFLTRDAGVERYSDAQIDDYHGLPRRRFPWRPPLTLRVRARFSHPNRQLKGTAGFGFWNDPFAMTGLRAPALPRALWFFYASPPANMTLALDVPGNGWKAATLDTTRLSALLWAPLAPLLIPLMNLRPLYRRLWPPVQRALAVSEVPLAVEADMTTWHDYRLEWGREKAGFFIDEHLALESGHPPRGPMGFVMWLDNQYAVATPQGRFGWGLVDAPGEQWMEVEHFSITGRAT
jgi:hypothetical protein